MVFCLLSKLLNLTNVFHQWGGTISAIFACTHLTHDICAGLLVALLPLIKADLELSYLQSGLLLTAYTITSGLSQFLGGLAGDRINRKLVIVTGLVGVGLTTMAVGLSSSYYPMLIVLVMLGIMSGAYHPSAASILSSYFGEARRGKVIAVHMVGGSTGFAIGPVLGGLMAQALGWRLTFIVLSIPILVTVPLVLRKVKSGVYTERVEPRSHVSSTQDAPVTATRGHTGIIRTLQAIAAVTTLAILFQFTAGCVMSFMPIYLVDKHNIATAYAAILLGILRGGGIAGILFGGWLSDKWGRRNAIFLSLVAIGPVLYLLTILPFNPAFLVVLVVFGIVMFIRQATIQSLLMDSAPAEIRGTIFGIYFGLSMEGASLVQPVAAYYMDIFGIVQVFHILALISVALSLVGLLLAIKAKLHR